MPWVENVSRNDIVTGRHSPAGNDTVLIQIVSPAGGTPVPNATFYETHQFEFLDIESTETELGEFAITDQQAEAIIEILHSALSRKLNVIVHCNAGICRSGAVAEVAHIMGFDTVGRYRQPNLLVKHKLMHVLGWT